MFDTIDISITDVRRSPGGATAAARSRFHMPHTTQSNLFVLFLSFASLSSPYPPAIHPHLTHTAIARAMQARARQLLCLLSLSATVLYAEILMLCSVSQPSTRPKPQPGLWRFRPLFPSSTVSLIALALFVPPVVRISFVLSIRIVNCSFHIMTSLDTSIHFPHPRPHLPRIPTLLTPPGHR